MTTVAEKKDGINLIKSEHEEVKGLFEAFRKAKSNNDMRTVQDLVQQMIRRLLQHSSAEEKALYPLLRDRLPNGRVIYDVQVTDDTLHKKWLLLLERLDLDRDGELFFNAVDKLIMDTLEHISVEEKLLDDLRKALKPAEIAKLEDSFRSASAEGETSTEVEDEGKSAKRKKQNDKASAPEDESEDKNKFKKMKVDELRSLCKEKNLNEKGRKDQLIARLEKAKDTTS
jgi:hypothetical protein